MAARRKPLIYLAGMITGSPDGVCKEWRDNVATIWKPEHVLDPLKNRDARDKDITKDNLYREIVDLDKREILASDVVLAKNVLGSAGTCMEIMFAYDRHIPVVIISQDKDEYESSWILYHSTKMVHTVDEALEWIKEHVVVVV